MNANQERATDMTQQEMDERAARMAAIAFQAAMDWERQTMTNEAFVDILTVAFKGCMVPLSPRILDVGWKLLKDLDEVFTMGADVDVHTMQQARKAAEAFEDAFPKRPKADDVPPG
jgi:hypothetical protein